MTRIKIIFPEQPWYRPAAPNPFAILKVMKAVSVFWLALLCTEGFPQKPEIGIVQRTEDDSIIFASGIHYLTESIQESISPLRFSDQEFEVWLASIRRLNVSVHAANIFFPAQLKLVGPTVNEDSLLWYARQVYKRCNRAQIRLIVWGSGGARRIPDGFEPGHAKDQFVRIARKLAEAAKPYGITLALENLNRSECNFINTITQAMEIVKAVNHPNLRLNCDIYHMLKEQEAAEDIRAAGRYIINCEIAESEGRTPPGTHREDFVPYLKALKGVGYRGKITMECRWTNLSAELPAARTYLQTQIDSAYR